MTQEVKQLLLTDICARLPYGVKVGNRDWDYPAVVKAVYSNLDVLVEDIFCYSLLGECFLYLRPMSSMTEEEKKEYHAIDSRAYTCPEDIAHIPAADRIEWLNAHHFDYRSLIPTGLALEAPEGMYKTE